MELLKQEFNNWLLLKKAIDKTPDGKLVSFGVLMAKKYNINDKELNKELDHNMALLRLMSKHVKREEDKL